MKPYISIPILITLSPMIFTACTSINSSPKEEKHQMELSLHKVRTELEDVKHNLNSYEIEHHVLEGKLSEQEEIISALKKQISEINQDKLESLQEEIVNIEKKCQQFLKKQEKISSEVRQLSSHANETTLALAQYKDKMAQSEKLIASQKEQLQEINKIKESLGVFTQAPIKSYVVQSGDSLEKIAREHGLTVEQIKHHNNMSSDLIVVGQEIQIPH